MSKKNITQSEWEIIVTCLENNRDLVSGALGRSISTISEQKEGWSNIADIVNSAGLGIERSGEDIKSKWSDFRCRTKKKATSISNYIGITGGAPPGKSKLTDIEERVLALIGPTCYEGVRKGVDMSQKKVLEKNKKPKTSVNSQNSSDEDVENIPIGSEQGEIPTETTTPSQEPHQMSSSILVDTNRNQHPLGPPGPSWARPQTGSTPRVSQFRKRVREENCERIDFEIKERQEKMQKTLEKNEHNTGEYVNQIKQLNENFIIMSQQISLLNENFVAAVTLLTKNTNE